LRPRKLRELPPRLRDHRRRQRATEFQTPFKMPRGSKSSYSPKQKRQAAHIEESYEKRGVGKKEAEERAWRTVNKSTGGAKGKKPSSRSRKKRSAPLNSGAAKKRATRK
jgi:hypothetical protein